MFEVMIDKMVDRWSGSLEAGKWIGFIAFIYFGVPFLLSFVVYPLDIGILEYVQLAPNIQIFSFTNKQRDNCQPHFHG